MTEADLNEEGISIAGSLAKKGMAMANLDEGIFLRVVKGELPQNRAIIIGENVDSPAKQWDVIKLT